MWSKQKNNGSVLVFCLVMLLVLTIVGTSGFNRVTMDEKVASNLRDKNVALQRTEIALREGEKALVDQTTRPTAGTARPSEVWQLGVQGSVTGSKSSEWILALDETWWASDAWASATASDSYYFIEEQEFKRDSLTSSGGYTKSQPGVYYYRITAKSEGNSSGESIVQSTYAKRYN